MKRMSLISISLLLVVLIFAGGCSDASYSSDPKQVVISLFGAMEKDDKAAIAHILDLPELMKVVNDDYALQTDKPRVFTSPQEVLEDLTETGLTKQRWFSFQRIVNEAEVNGETATVGVTFVDKKNSKGYMAKFGLHLVNGKWKIYTFNTVKESDAGY
ncbi:MAG: hypothetical protein DWP97_10965 [Calditrichaeota bacterium]|nr:MAG: hypothetical protein DWP97_10965 [Calditrichota bacterium]